MKVSLVYNPGAGDDEQSSGAELVSLIREAGHDTTCFISKKNGWKEALEQPADVIAVAGGDGTVGKVAKRLIGRSTPIAVLPIGTANNLARSLGLAGRPLEELIRGWAVAKRVKFDVGTAQGPWGSKYFLEGLGIGLFTETMSRLEVTDNVDLAHLDDADEKITSVQAILRARLQDCAARKMTLKLDGAVLSGHYILLELMNIPLVGPNLYLAPDAISGDGVLHLVLISDAERDAFRDYLDSCIAGKPSVPNLKVRTTRRARIELEGSSVHIDDKLWPTAGFEVPASPITIDARLRRQQVDFLVPG